MAFQEAFPHDYILLEEQVSKCHGNIKQDLYLQVFVLATTLVCCSGPCAWMPKQTTDCYRASFVWPRQSGNWFHPSFVFYLFWQLGGSVSISELSIS
jgi:hypothetical protein